MLKLYPLFCTSFQSNSSKYAFKLDRLPELVFCPIELRFALATSGLVLRRTKDCQLSYHLLREPNNVSLRLLFLGIIRHGRNLIARFELSSETNAIYSYAAVAAHDAIPTRNGGLEKT